MIPSLFFLSAVPPKNVLKNLAIFSVSALSKYLLSSQKLREKN